MLVSERHLKISHFTSWKMSPLIKAEHWKQAGGAPIFRMMCVHPLLPPGVYQSGSQGSTCIEVPVPWALSPVWRELWWTMDEVCFCSLVQAVSKLQRVQCALLCFPKNGMGWFGRGEDRILEQLLEALLHSRVGVESCWFLKVSLVHRGSLSLYGPLTRARSMEHHRWSALQYL